MLVSTRSRQASGRNSRSMRQLLAILGLAALCLVVAQGFSPMAASGNHGSLDEAGSVSAESGVGLSRNRNLPDGSSAFSGDAEVCDLGHSIPCEENKKCRGRLQCSISCSDCYKKNPTDVKGRCHKFPPD